MQREIFNNIFRSTSYSVSVKMSLTPLLPGVLVTSRLRGSIGPGGSDAMALLMPRPLVLSTST